MENTAFELDYYMVGLKKNPFKPTLSDQRDPDEIILEGTNYMKYVSLIKRVVRNINEETSSIIIIRGKIGMGKTAIIKRAYKEIGHKIPIGADNSIEIVNMNNKKIITMYIRAKQQDEPFIKLFGQIVEGLFKKANKEQPKTREIIRDPIKFAKAISNISSELNVSGMVVAFDQLERTQEGSLLDSLQYIREFYNSKSIGCALIFSSARDEELIEFENLCSDYIGDVKPIIVKGLNKEETLILISEIFRRYRINEPPNIVSEYDRPYYPFTKAGLNTILDYIYRGVIYVSPRYIYHVLGNILDEALIRGLIPIDEERALNLLASIGIYDIEWFDALNTPYHKFRDALKNIFRFMSIYKRYIEISNKKVQILATVFTSRINENDINNIFKLKGKQSDINEIISLVKRGMSVIIYVSVNGIPHAYLIKYGKKVNRSHIESVAELLTRIEGIKLAEHLLNPEKIIYKLIILDYLPLTVEETLNKLPTISSITIEEPWIVDSQDPRDYGALMALYQHFQKIGLHKAKEDKFVLDTLEKIVPKIFSIIRTI